MRCKLIEMKADGKAIKNPFFLHFYFDKKVEAEEGETYVQTEFFKEHNKDKNRVIFNKTMGMTESGQGFLFSIGEKAKGLAAKEQMLIKTEPGTIFGDNF